MSTASNKVRKWFGEGDAKRDCGLSTPNNVKRYDDIAYDDKSPLQVLDVYRPKEKEDEMLPVIVNVHGGGWVYGSKENYQYYCMELAQYGFAVVNFSYRLAPEDRFPASLEDTVLVFQWIRTNAIKYGFDTQNIFGMGDSAGAHLLGIYANFCTNPIYRKQIALNCEPDICPKAMVLNCGVYHVTKNEDELTGDLLTDLIGKKPSDENLKLLSVAENMTKLFPPTLYMTCTGDVQKKHAPLLGKALLEHSIAHKFYFYSEGDTDLGHVFHLNIRSIAAQLCNKEEMEYLLKFVNK